MMGWGYGWGAYAIGDAVWEEADAEDIILGSLLYLNIINI
jgi:hypothetical protein